MATGDIIKGVYGFIAAVAPVIAPHRSIFTGHLQAPLEDHFND